MAYRFHVNQRACINCGICMDLCPVRCLDMTRPSGEGEPGTGAGIAQSDPRRVGHAWLDDAGSGAGGGLSRLPGLCAGVSDQCHRD